jgi:Zn-finger protein
MAELQEIRTLVFLSSKGSHLWRCWTTWSVHTNEKEEELLKQIDEREVNVR